MGHFLRSAGSQVTHEIGILVTFPINLFYMWRFLNSAPDPNETQVHFPSSFLCSLSLSFSSGYMYAIDDEWISYALFIKTNHSTGDFLLISVLSTNSAEEDEEFDFAAYSPPGPYFDREFSKNVTALVGKTASLSCRVLNAGNRTVSRSSFILPFPFHLRCYTLQLSLQIDQFKRDFPFVFSLCRSHGWDTGTFIC
jgi:hypothetical protein